MNTDIAVLYLIVGLLVWAFLVLPFLAKTWKAITLYDVIWSSGLTSLVWPFVVIAVTVAWIGDHLDKVVLWREK